MKPKPDFRAVADAITNKRSVGPMDEWLAEDPVRAAEFWEFIDYGQSKGKGYRPLVDAWNANFDPIPIRYNQVRERHLERMREPQGS